MYTGTTVLDEFSELQYSLSPSYQAARLLVYMSKHFWCYNRRQKLLEQLRKTALYMTPQVMNNQLKRQSPYDLSSNESRDHYHEDGNLQPFTEIIETNAKKGLVLISHKQCNALFREHIVRLKIISLYIYKDLRLKT